MTRFLVVLLLALRPLFAYATEETPARVDVGVFVNSIKDLSLRDSHYVIDFYVWFRWKAEGCLADFKPLDALEIMNGRIDNRVAQVEKTTGSLKYASVRLQATIDEVWDLRRFPFDQHRLRVHLENSQLEADKMVFVADVANSRLGDEIRLPGWRLSDFRIDVGRQAYKSNYGDVSQATDPTSSYSRLTFSMSMVRDGSGIAFKILTIVIVSTLIAFVAFLIRPTDLDPRFGLGVGAQFGLAASWFVVSEMIPASAVLTLADAMLMIAMTMVFVSVVVSARALRLAEANREATSARLDRWCIVAFPLFFLGACLVAARIVW